MNEGNFTLTKQHQILNCSYSILSALYKTMGYILRRFYYNIKAAPEGLHKMIKKQHHTGKVKLTWNLWHNYIILFCLINMPVSDDEKGYPLNTLKRMLESVGVSVYVNYLFRRAFNSEVI